ncbi:retrovirus-related pol polyprotein from transposon TNT 1-94 [Tanacetum coccineum]
MSIRSFAMYACLGTYGVIGGKIAKDALFLELYECYFEDYYSEDQYAVSIKEDMAYGINIIFWKISSVVPTLRNAQYAVSNSWIPRDLDNSTSNVVIPLDSWTSGLQVYKLPLSDDIIFGSTNPGYTQLFSDLMKSRFKMSMMEEMTFFLGLQVNQCPYGIFINQSNYMLEILKKYGIETCDPVGTLMEIKDKLDLDQNRTLVDATKYRSMIGALMYLTVKEGSGHSTMPLGTINMGLWYTKDFGFELTGFLDVDYAGCKDTFKSTSSGAQFLGENLVSWSSKKPDCMTLSTTEAEYVSLSACSSSHILQPVQHSEKILVVVRYHFIKDHVEKSTIELYFVKTDYQLADLFTKALLVDRFNYLVRHLGMRSSSPQELERLAKSQ